MQNAHSPYRPPLALAMQGGTSLGFFGWGMLEGLLASNRVKLDALCGSNTGALNALLVADGMAGGDETTAIHKLESFWRSYAELLAKPSADAQPQLRQMLADSIDFERLQHYSPVYLLISASRVRDGHQRVFRSHEITVDVLTACLSLPLAHAPVALQGDLYWDGGYGVSLPLRQLVMETRADDVLLMQEETILQSQIQPSNCSVMSQLINQQSLGAALQREIDAINEMVDICLDEGLSHSRRSRKLQRLRLHHLTQEMPAPRLNGEPGVPGAPGTPEGLLQLREQGRLAAEHWLAQRPQPRLPPRQAPRVERRRVALA